MKKFYSLIAAALVGTMVASAANVLNGPVKKLENARIHSVEELNLNFTPNAERFQNALNKDVKSRADIEFTDCTQFLFYDYDFNWYSEGKQLDSFRDLMSSQGMNFIDNGDGTVTAEDFGGWGVFQPVFRPTAGGCEVDLGQLLYKNEKYLYVLGGVVINEKNQLSLTIEGTQEFEPLVNQNNEVVGYYILGLGVYVLEAKTNQLLGYMILDVDVFALAPNATLEYTYQTLDQETGEVVEGSVCNYIYVELHDADEENVDYPWPSIWLSNVTTWNEGVGVNFYYDTEAELGVDVMVALDQIAFPSQEAEEDVWTGDFYVSFVTANQINIGTVLADETETGITWPVDDSDLGIEGSLGWCLCSEGGYNYPICSPATLTFGIKEPGSVIDIDTECNEAPVYYNIQGMRVENPQAGQLIIKKQGNKATKLVIR